MSMRQGLFRFWVVLSLLWGCLVGFAVFADANTVAGSNLEFSGLASREEVKAAIVNLLKQKIINGAVLSPRDAEETATEISQKYTSKDFPEFALQTSSLLVSVPAVLFVLGALLFWIGAGFRRPAELPKT
jgi:hypothetical protein